VSRRCAFAAATFLLTACGAADTGGPNTGDETARAEPVAGREDDGTVTGAENAGEAPLDLPYGSKFTVANSLDTQRFVVPDNTRVSVHVLATARWNAPSRCQGRKFVISLEKEPGRQDLPTDGSLGTGSWQNVPEGAYHFNLKVVPPDVKTCSLSGTIEIMF
jgi:hypothetical protein